MAWISLDSDRTLFPRDDRRCVVRKVLIGRRATLAVAVLFVPPQAGA
jgi:hypothetical protein